MAAAHPAAAPGGRRPLYTRKRPHCAEYPTKHKAFMTSRISCTMAQDKDSKEKDSKDSKLATVWIIGSKDYITGAQKTAIECYGENLDLNATVSWIGKANMRWGDVLNQFYRELSQHRSFPDVLVLHVGSNDLGNTNVSDLADTMLNDLTHLHQAFPRMKIVYSFITPRLAWGKFDYCQMNVDRITVNKMIQYNTGLFNGVVIEYPKLLAFQRHLFQPNGIGFTIEGFEMFVNEIHDTIEQILNLALSADQSRPQSSDVTPCVTHGPQKMQMTMPEKENTSKEPIIEMSATVSQPAQKRKLESETDSESYLPVPKKRRACEDDIAKKEHSSEASQALPGDEHWPSNNKSLLKRKRGSEDLLSPAKKRKLLDDNVSQNLPLASEGKLELVSCLPSPTVIQPEKIEKETSGSPEVCNATASYPTTKMSKYLKNIIGAPNVWIAGSYCISKAQLAWMDLSITFTFQDFSNKDFLNWVNHTITGD